jgi:hypothetical protein
VGRTDLRASLLRGAARAVVAAVVLGLLAAYAGLPAVAIATAVQVGLLALPVALVESWAMRRSGVRRILLLMPLVFVGAWVAIGLAYFQAVYGEGVFRSGAFEAGWGALDAELNRLAGRDDDLFDVWVGLTEAVAMAGLAAGLVCAALGRPFAYLTTSNSDRVYGWPAWVASCVAVYLGTVMLATLMVVAYVAIGERRKVLELSPMYMFFLGITGLPAVLAFGVAHLVGDRITRPYLEATPS